MKEENNHVRQEISREQQEKLDRQQKIHDMVDEFNRLVDQERYPEAEVVAKRARELAPRDPLVEQINRYVKLAKWEHEGKMVKEAQEEGFMQAMDNVDRSAIPHGDNPYEFPDPKKWKDISGARAKLAMRERHRNEQEMLIEKKLRTPVSVSFKNTPLRR